MNKEELIRKCTGWCACGEALAWLDAQPSGLSAEEIWARCVRADWKIWLARRAGVHPRVFVRLAVKWARYAPAPLGEAEVALQLAEKFAAGENVRLGDLFAASFLARKEEASVAYACACAAACCEYEAGVRDEHKAYNARKDAANDAEDAALSARVPESVVLADINEAIPFESLRFWGSK